jgi:hypothetical protein
VSETSAFFAPHAKCDDAFNTVFTCFANLLVRLTRFAQRGCLVDIAIRTRCSIRFCAAAADDAATAKKHRQTRMVKR